MSFAFNKGRYSIENENKTETQVEQQYERIILQVQAIYTLLASSVHTRVF